jgi:hypothetical protein
MVWSHKRQLLPLSPWIHLPTRPFARKEKPLLCLTEGFIAPRWGAGNLCGLCTQGSQGVAAGLRNFAPLALAAEAPSSNGPLGFALIDFVPGRGQNRLYAQECL